MYVCMYVNRYKPDALPVVQLMVSKNAEMRTAYA